LATDVSEVRTASIIRDAGMMMEAVRTSETSVANHFTRQYIPEDNSEHYQRWLSLICKNHIQPNVAAE
jgi:hypothetical protein